VVSDIGGSIGGNPGISDKMATQLSKNTNALTKAEIAMAQEEYTATAFLLGADRSQFGKLLDKLQNDYLQGYSDCYPKTVTDAYNLLINEKQDPLEEAMMVLHSLPPICQSPMEKIKIAMVRIKTAMRQHLQPQIWLAVTSVEEIVAPLLVSDADEMDTMSMNVHMTHTRPKVVKWWLT
jgi:hypothetical protein